MAPIWQTRYLSSHLQTLAVFLLATQMINVTHAQTNEDTTAVVTGKLVLGTHDGSAQPSICGHGYTGGGNIDIAQPTADTLVITMTGAAAACAKPFTTAEAVLEFCQAVHFGVEFSEPGCTGRLFIQATVNGLLRADGKHTTVGLMDATTSIMCGPTQIATLSVPARMEADGGSRAITASCGPLSVPVYAGQFSLFQHFQISATQRHGLSCGKASAEFSSTALTDAWTATRDPFQGVNKEHLGFQVVVRVVPDPIVTKPSSASLDFSFSPVLSTSYAPTSAQRP